MAKFFRATLVVSAVGLAACGAREPASDADKLARGRELVQQMSAQLAAASAISVTTIETARPGPPLRREGAAVADGGLHRAASQQFLRQDDRRPRPRVLVQRKDADHRLAPHKVFAQAPMPDTIDLALDALAERYDMSLPMGDLFYSSAEKALLSDTTTGGYAGIEKVGDTSCMHLAFHDTGVDWDLWLPEQGDPLPKRFKVVQKGRTGQPAVDVTFTAWNLAPADRRHHLQAEGAGGLRGHRRPAAHRGRQEERRRCEMKKIIGVMLVVTLVARQYRAHVGAGALGAPRRGGQGGRRHGGGRSAGRGRQG